MITLLLFGHLIGDYFLQTGWMAVNKVKNNLEGWLACTVHTIVYTLSICVVTSLYDWYWIIAVFLSHFFIDKFSLAKVYMKTILKSMPFPTEKDTMNYTSIYWIVYVALDNGAHLMLMYLMYNILY